MRNLSKNDFINRDNHIPRQTESIESSSTQQGIFQWLPILAPIK